MKPKNGHLERETRPWFAKRHTEVHFDARQLDFLATRPTPITGVDLPDGLHDPRTCSCRVCAAINRMQGGGK